MRHGDEAGVIVGRWYLPSALGWPLVAAHGCVPLLLLGGAWIGVSAVGGAEGWAMGGIPAAVLVTLLPFLRPWALAVKLTDDCLLVLSSCGVRRIPWHTVATVQFWTDPRAASELGWWETMRFVGTYVTARGRPMPFADGITLVLAGARPSAHVALSEAFVSGGRDVLRVVCSWARARPPAHHVLPVAHQLRTSVLYRAAWAYGAVCLLVIGAISGGAALSLLHAGATAPGLRLPVTFVCAAASAMAGGHLAVLAGYYLAVASRGATRPERTEDGRP